MKKPWLFTEVCPQCGAQLSAPLGKGDGFLVDCVERKVKRARKARLLTRMSVKSG